MASRIPPGTSAQKSISSFFKPKTQKLARAVLPALSKRPGADDDADDKEGSGIEHVAENSAKRRKITLDMGESKAASQETKAVAASDHTAKYVFSSSSAPEGPVSEAERLRRESIHCKFVEKLSRTPLRPRHLAEAASEEIGHEQEQDQAVTGPQNLTPMVKQYLELKRQHLDKVIIYQVGYKYQFFGQDARIAAKELNIVCIPGQYHYDGYIEKLASASIPLFRLHVHVKRLVTAGYKVGVVNQLETAALKAVGNNRNTPFTRELTHVYTRGTYVDDVIPNEDTIQHGNASGVDTGYLVCLTESIVKGHTDDEKTHIGLLAIQPATGAIVYDDFEDGFMRTELETRILHIAPCEYLVVGDPSSTTRKMIKSLSSGNNVFGVKARVEQISKSQTAAAEAFSHVNSFYTGKLQSSQQPGEAKALDQIRQLSEHVTICLSAMINYLGEYGLDHILSLTTNFQDFNNRTHMLIHGNALGSLEIYAAESSKKGSLFWLLDKTKTRFGRRMLRHWVGRPLLNRDMLRERVEAVEELRLSIDKSTRESDRLRRVLNKTKSDLEKILVRIYYKRASRQEVVRFLQAMHYLATEYSHVQAKDNAGFESEMLNHTAATLTLSGPNTMKFLGRINQPVTEDKACFFRGDAETETITDLKAGIAAIEHDLMEHRAEAAKMIGKNKVQYKTVAGIEFLIETDHKEKVPASWRKISSTKKVSRYHTLQVLDFIRERDQYKESLDAACEDAFQHFMEDISESYQVYRDSIHSLAVLDCLTSLAEIAQMPGYCKPEFVEDSQIEVKNGRHPMAEQLMMNNYVPNDVSLISEVSAVSQDAASTLLITGPNMGGKSSYVRSIALICIMAQCGSFVPAESARLGMLDGIYTRMGAMDNMLRGESTFMVELNETCDILKRATKRSLVILDELGRGTSTHDGVAIAEAVLRELLDRKIMCMFITHYQDLAKVERVYNGQLRNVHVKFESCGEQGKEEITFLYEIGEGVAYRSYGLNVARLANLPQSILDVASIRSRALEESVGRRKALYLARLVAKLVDMSSCDKGANMAETVEGLRRLVNAIEYS